MLCLGSLKRWATIQCGSRISPRSRYRAGKPASKPWSRATHIYFSWVPTTAPSSQRPDSPRQKTNGSQPNASASHDSFSARSVSTSTLSNRYSRRLLGTTVQVASTSPLLPFLRCFKPLPALSANWKNAKGSRIRTAFNGADHPLDHRRNVQSRIQLFRARTS